MRSDEMCIDGEPQKTQPVFQIVFPDCLVPLEQAFAALKQNGLALLMGEQNVPFTARVADRYLILSHGHVTAEGGREDLASPEKLADAFMGLADDTTKTGGGFT